MSNSIQLQDSPVTPPSTGLRESAWLAWVSRHAVSDRKQAASLRLGIKWLGLAVLLATALLPEYAGGYHLFIRFAVSLTAIAVASHAWHLKQYSFVAAFAAVTMVCNPILPMFPMDPDVRSSLPLFGVLAFTASIAWLREEPLPDPCRAIRTTTPGPMRPQAEITTWENEGGSSTVHN